MNVVVVDPWANGSTDRHEESEVQGGRAREIEILARYVLRGVVEIAI